MASTLNEMTLDFDSFRVTAFPKIDRVVFVSKWTGESESYTGAHFCQILDRVAEYKRASCSKEKRLLDEKHRLEQTLKKLRHGKTKAS